MIEIIGLIIFLIVVGINVIVLGIDAILKWVLKVPTISQWIWKKPLLGIPIIIFEIIGVIGLVVHLYYK